MPERSSPLVALEAHGDIHVQHRAIVSIGRGRHDGNASEVSGAEDCAGWRRKLKRRATREFDDTSEAVLDQRMRRKKRHAIVDLP
jgi:hypothetical protein